MHDNETVFVDSRCYYCKNQKEFLNFPVNPKGDTLKTKHFLPDTFSDLHGHLLLVAFLDNYPYMFCGKIEETVFKSEFHRICLEGFGSEARLLDALSEKLNFKFTLVQLGFIYNQSSDDMLYKINETKVDFAIGGLTITPGRGKNVTYTNPFRYEYYVSLYRPRKGVFETQLFFIAPV